MASWAGSSGSETLPWGRRTRGRWYVVSTASKVEAARLSRKVLGMGDKSPKAKDKNKKQGKDQKDQKDAKAKQKAAASGDPNKKK